VLLDFLLLAIDSYLVKLFLIIDFLLLSFQLFVQIDYFNFVLVNHLFIIVHLFLEKLVVFARAFVSVIHF
jgi:hypothetical protein